MILLYSAEQELLQFHNINNTHRVTSLLLVLIF